MPYAGASLSQAIAVLAPTITVNLDKTMVARGELMTISGQVLTDTTPWSGAVVWLFLNATAPGAEITSVVTDVNGNFSYTWTVPFYDAEGYPIGCRENTIYAREESTGATAQATFWGFYISRIRDFTAPSTIIVNQYFTVSGYLEYESEPNVWSPRAKTTVDIFYATADVATTLGTTTTDLNGYFELYTSIPETGTFDIGAIAPLVYP